MMPVELERTSLRDIDLERGVINAVGCKGHRPRALKLKPSTIVMLKRHLGENPSDYPFPKSERISEAWRRYRNDLTEKLNEPTLKTIRLYDLRHYFGTMTYHQTRDILLVKQLMGHSKIETTLIYTQLVNFAQDEYTVRAASTIKEATALLEAGFEYVCTWQGKQLYRKRK
jgi:integrase/recombinase XerD